jgi:hypothetical protein
MSRANRRFFNSSSILTQKTEISWYAWINFTGDRLNRDPESFSAPEEFSEGKISPDIDDGG